MKFFWVGLCFFRLKKNVQLVTSPPASCCLEHKILEQQQLFCDHEATNKKFPVKVALTS